jgi:hypothetical protein
LRKTDYLSVAQPPLPLHEFLPLQSLSAVLQPPWPLQAFMPLQECFAIMAVSPEVPGELIVELVPAELSLLQPVVIAAAPATKPVIAAAARIRVDRAGIECSFQKQ